MAITSPTSRVSSASATLVTGAARAAGVVADAVVVVDPREHERRAANGLGAVTSLEVLDALMCLPLGVAVTARDLGQRARSSLVAAPRGMVEWAPDLSWVRRLGVPAAEVALVVVSASRWAAGLRRAAAFGPFAPRVVVLDRLPREWPAPALDAVAAGVGVWVRDEGDTVEMVAPAAYRPRVAKAAKWRFAERAYETWIRSTAR